MAGQSITAANSVYMLGITGLFTVPQRLQGFAADDVFSTEPLQSSEVQMGVDGRLSGGFVYKEIIQRISLQADSDSNFLFDEWWSAMQQAAEVLTAEGLVILPNLGTKWALVRGFLTQYQPMPDAKKLLQPRVHGITWQSISPAVT